MSGIVYTYGENVTCFLPFYDYRRLSADYYFYIPNKLKIIHVPFDNNFKI